MMVHWRHGAGTRGGYHSLALKSEGSQATWDLNKQEHSDMPIVNEFIDLARGWKYSLAVVREPITLVLLGLGGATLLRKRKG